MATIERQCTCRKFAIDPRCVVHGIGRNRFLANLAGLVVLVVVVAVALMTAPADGARRHRNTRAICQVFGRYCEEALRVSWCESRWSVYARNGQYLGLFQMGSWERRKFGHGRDAWTQSRAALRYFRASGRDWSPWSCGWSA